MGYDNGCEESFGCLCGPSRGQAPGQKSRDGARRAQSGAIRFRGVFAFARSFEANDRKIQRPIRHVFSSPRRVRLPHLLPSNRPGPQRQKQVRIKKAAMLHGIVFPGSPGSRCIRPDRNLKHPATQEQPDDRGSMLGLPHRKKTQHIRFLTTTMDSRLRGEDEKRRVLSDRRHPKSSASLSPGPPWTWFFYRSHGPATPPCSPAG